MMPLIGTTIAHYRINEMLGAGGMGVVYRAEDLTLHRAVALKFLAPEIATDEEYRARFLREARVVAALNHPNTCTVYEVGEVGSSEESAQAAGAVPARGTPFIAMEFIQGETLAARLSRVGRLDAAEAVELALQIAEALSEAHRHQIVHRDLKPHNVMITAGGLVKIVDFGLAKPLTPPRSANGPRSTSEVISAEFGCAVVVGTCDYMSPEQGAGKRVDARSDVFAFGVMLYEMLTGQLPFRGNTPTATIAKILEAEPEPFPAAATHVPPALIRIVRRCLQKRPEDRYDTEELVIRLTEVRQPSSIRSAIWAVLRRSWEARDRVTGGGWLEGRRLATTLILLLVVGPLSYSVIQRLEDRRGGKNDHLASSRNPAAVLYRSNGVARSTSFAGSDSAPTTKPLAAAASRNAESESEKSSHTGGRFENGQLTRSATRPTHADRQVATPPPTNGTLLVTSTPAFSSVALDGTVVGVTPVTIKADPGTHELTLTSPDRLHWRGRIDVARGQTVKVHRELAAVGGLTMTSDVWVEVSLDGGPPDQTPVHIPRVAAGLHELRAFREGYVTRVLEVFIEEGKTTTVRVNLEKK